MRPIITQRRNLSIECGSPRWTPFRNRRRAAPPPGMRVDRTDGPARTHRPCLHHRRITLGTSRFPHIAAGIRSSFPEKTASYRPYSGLWTFPESKCADGRPIAADGWFSRYFFVHMHNLDKALTPKTNASIVGFATSKESAMRNRTAHITVSPAACGAKNRFPFMFNLTPLDARIDCGHRHFGTLSPVYSYRYL